MWNKDGERGSVTQSSTTSRVGGWEYENTELLSGEGTTSLRREGIRDG